VNQGDAGGQALGVGANERLHAARTLDDAQRRPRTGTEHAPTVTPRAGNRSPAAAGFTVRLPAGIHSPGGAAAAVEETGADVQGSVRRGQPLSRASGYFRWPRKRNEVVSPGHRRGEGGRPRIAESVGCGGSQPAVLAAVDGGGLTPLFRSDVSPTVRRWHPDREVCLFCRVTLPDHFRAEISLVPPMRNGGSNPSFPDEHQHIDAVV
jgi:hypothetical protein